MSEEQSTNTSSDQRPKKKPHMIKESGDKKNTTKKGSTSDNKNK